MVLCRVLSRATLADHCLRSSSNLHPFKNLPPPKISCPSFPDRRSLFSIACSLFPQNTGVAYPFRDIGSTALAMGRVSSSHSDSRPFSRAQVSLESTLAKVYQNKQLQLPLESTLMQKPAEGEDIVNYALSISDRHYRTLRSDGVS